MIINVKVQRYENTELQKGKRGDRTGRPIEVTAAALNLRAGEGPHMSGGAQARQDHPSAADRRGAAATYCVLSCTFFRSFTRYVTIFLIPAAVFFRLGSSSNSDVRFSHPSQPVPSHHIKSRRPSAHLQISACSRSSQRPRPRPRPRPPLHGDAHRQPPCPTLSIDKTTIREGLIRCANRPMS